MQTSRTFRGTPFISEDQKTERIAVPSVQERDRASALVDSVAALDPDKLDVQPYY